MYLFKKDDPKSHVLDRYVTKAEKRRKILHNPYVILILLSIGMLIFLYACSQLGGTESAIFYNGGLA